MVIREITSNFQAATFFISGKSFLLAALLAGISLSARARAQTYYLDLTNQALTVSDNTLGVEKVVDGR